MFFFSVFFKAHILLTMKELITKLLLDNCPKGNERYSHGRTCTLQKFIEIQGWLLLTFFICLHNQLSSFNSIIVQMSEKPDSSCRQ